MVSYLHSQNVVHRDLKLENILLDRRTGNIKIIDFGLARFFEDSQLLSTRCGSEEYAAPEVIKGDPYDGRKSDIWAIGIILYAMLFGCLPFNASEPGATRKLFHKICNNLYRIPQGQVSLEAEDVIKAVLTVHPQERPTLKSLSHFPWIEMQQ